MHVWSVLLALPWLGFITLAVVLTRRKPRLLDHQIGGKPEPLVSIIVPARNEALNIATCVQSLAQSAYSNREIIVINDGSTDATGQIAREIAAREAGITVVDNDPLPAGWVGKPWACWTGYQRSRGELLLFTDADTNHTRALLQHAVAALHDTGAALVTLLPRQRMETFWEALILPHIILAIQMGMGSTAKMNRTRNPRRVIANGQFILMRREVYERIGGHAAIRGEVVEDLRLAQLVVASGERLYLAHAAELMETRMYRSLPEIIEGWTKNLARGARLVMPQRLGSAIIYAAAIAGTIFWAAPPSMLIGSLFSHALEPWRAWAALTTAASLAFWLCASWYERIPWLPAFFYPAGAAIASFLMVRSSVRGNRVEWRGREYELANP